MSLLHVVYFTPKWKNHQSGFLFELKREGFSKRSEYFSIIEIIMSGRLSVPLDPLTAIGLGLVTAEELELPEGLRAAFNLLK